MVQLSLLAVNKLSLAAIAAALLALALDAASSSTNNQLVQRGHRGSRSVAAGTEMACSRIAAALAALAQPRRCDSQAVWQAFGISLATAAEPRILNHACA